MEFFFSVVLLLHVLSAIGVIGLVLVQHGKGADMGAAFGSGASGSLFGSSGSANILSRTTAVLAVIFFLTSLSLAYIAAHKPRTSGSVMQDVVKSQPVQQPAAAGADKAEIPAGSGSKSQEIPK